MRRTLLTIVTAGVMLAICFPGWAQAPEAYTWKNVQIQGGGFVTGLIYHPNARNLLYARTDVGGAYRWEAATATWIPLTDQLGPAEENLTGVLSLAPDPSDPDRVYLAAGLYTPSWAGTAALFASSDRGATWARSNLPIKLGGNEDGRSTGERLQVDPNQGNILFLGSSTDGLWKSVDWGATWGKVSGFPVAASPVGSGGISFVLLDAASGTQGKAMPTLYVGVLQKGINLYKSMDGGNSWQPVAGAPTANMPHQAALASDGSLYLTYSNGPGPNNVTAGAVWRLYPATGQWTNISPPAGQGGYTGLALDPQQPGTLLVSTLNRWWPRDEVFLSKDSGATWKPLLATASLDHSLAPYAAASTPHWIGDVALDPYDFDKAWFTTGYGVYQTNNLTASEGNAPTTWTFQNRGLEETVPLQLISPPAGAPLLSALGDIDGFRHDDLDTSPAVGRFSPAYGTNTSLDFAALQPTFMARIHNNKEGKYGAYSTDGGNTWQAFASAPLGASGGGSVAVSADGSTMVWAPGGSSNIFYSRNKGNTWNQAAGVSRNNLKPVADRVNSARFYTYDATSGQVLVSSDGGASFSRAASGLPAVPEWQLRRANLKSVFGQERALWLTNPTGGLYHSSDGGQSFQQVAGVQEASHVGFGKAAEGQPYPAVFIAGSVNQQTGFYRSDDAGKTWVKINMAHQQYGGVNDITGDPRRFGRVYVATSGRGILYGDAMGVVSSVSAHGQLAFSYAPNPFRETLQLQAAETFNYTITDLVGKQLEAGECGSGCSVGNRLPPGVYVLHAWQRNRHSSIKIVKN
ncbi:xyloglucanase [Pontibacter sp. CAU 1760]